MSTGVVSVRLPDDLRDRLDRLAETTGRPAAFYVREALTKHLADLEWAYGIAVAAEGARAGLVETRPLTVLMDDLGVSPDELDELPPVTEG